MPAMKLVIMFALVATVVAYPNNGLYDNFDVDEVIKNDRLYHTYVQCFLGKGKCTPQGTGFKEVLPDATQTGCGHCSEKEKYILAKVMKFCKEKHPEDWNQLNDIFNPGGKYDATLNQYIETYSA